MSALPAAPCCGAARAVQTQGVCQMPLSGMDAGQSAGPRIGGAPCSAARGKRATLVLGCASEGRASAKFRAARAAVDAVRAPATRGGHFTRAPRAPMVRRCAVARWPM